MKTNISLAPFPTFFFISFQDKIDDSFEDYGEDDLPRLQKELDEILQRFDVCIIKKHKLKEQIKEFTILVDTTVALFDR